MAAEAGLTFEYVGTGSRQLAPLVLLHGSGQSETFLISFAGRVAPDRGAFAVRGSVPWEGGYAFFRRNADRTLDQDDLAARCSEFCGFLTHLRAAGHRGPIVIGYSNGAIMAAAAAVRAPELSSGSILLRPLSPDPEGSFQQLHGYPVLLLGGAVDERRSPSDTSNLAEQFRRSGAMVAAQLLPAGHGLGDDDDRLCAEWLAGKIRP